MAGRDKDLDAAERALDGAPGAGESTREARRRHDWELRLAPLSELLHPVPPPAGLFETVMRRIDLDELQDDLAHERRRAARWRMSTVAVTAAAAALLIFVAPPGPVETPREYVAVATSDGGGPALIVAFDLAKGIATVRPVGIEAPQTGSLELWHIEAGSPPRSLGLVDPARPVQTQLAAAPGDVVAVSLEPAGGSPTGEPTGPVLYSGSLVAVE